MSPYTHRINLLHNVVPISHAASALAALIRQAAAEGAPVVVTQKGSPSAVLLSIDHYAHLVALVTAAPDPVGDDG